MFKKLLLFLAGFIFLLLPQIVSAQEIEYHYFHGQGCPHCAKVEEYFEKNKIEEKYKITKYEVYYNRENGLKFLDYFRQYNVPANKQSVPALFFEDKYLIGDRDIINYFASKEKVSITPPPVIQEYAERKAILSSLTLPAVIIASLVDAINPCAFAVLIILLSATTILKKDKTALYSGLAFSLAIFISYFLMGLGLYKALSLGKFPLIFMRVIGVLAVILGLFNLKDYFWYGKGFVMEVPFSWRPKMKQYIRSVTNPYGAFIVGLLVSLFLLPCTSGPYIIILGMLSQKETYLTALFYLFIYNLIFVSPMILITLVSYRGLSPERIESIRQKNIKRLHLIAGALLIGLGGYLLAAF